MDNLEDMKLMWQELNNRVSHLEEENKVLMQRVMRSDYKTAQEKLVAKYWMFIIWATFMIILMTCFLLLNPFVNETYRIATVIYWDVFFMIEIILDGYLLARIKKLDIYNTPVKEVAKTAAHNWKMHKIGLVVGLPLAFGAIILYALALNANKFTIFGMCVGGCIGALIGTRQLIKFKNYYKFLQVNDD